MTAAPEFTRWLSDMQQRISRPEFPSLDDHRSNDEELPDATKEADE